MSVRIEVIGKDRIKTMLERIPGGMDVNLRRELDVIAEKIKTDAKDFCPVDTGSLKASIRKEAVARPATNVWEVGVRAGGYITNPKSGNKVNYAIHVEYGTRYMAPRAFLRPAARMNATAIRDAIWRALSRAIKGDK